MARKLSRATELFAEASRYLAGGVPSDPSLDRVGPLPRLASVAGTAGQQPSSASDLVIAPCNDRGRLAQILDRQRGEIAAIVTGIGARGRA
jgi:hypothetical protein